MMPSDEYERMARLEERLWWYRALHERVLRSIRAQFGERRDLRILDAGCGTGGLLHFLKKAGYTDVQGVEGAAEGVAFCQQRGLNVVQLDLNEFATYQPVVRQAGVASPDATFDVIICNDVFCYFRDEALIPLITELGKRLRAGDASPGGLLLSNNNAFQVFWGQHDLAVGSLRRFVRADFATLAPQAGLRVVNSTYWSLALSPLILAARGWQRLQLWLRPEKEAQPASDVQFPGTLVNETLYHVVNAEARLLRSAPFGSSLFVSFRR